LREKFKDAARPGEPVVVDISRYDLANIVGTGNENVVRLLKEFKLAGILDSRGRKIFIHDIRKLVELSGCGL
jgi:CRP-like cAMP-binding protein